MALQGNVAVAPPGVRGLDCDTAVTAAQAQAYFNQGFRFCIRYVSRTDALRAGHAGGATPDLSEAEAAGILAAGMAVMAVQHPANVGWSPSADLGTAYGANAARYAAAAGLPAGVNLWLDLEGVAAGTAAADVIAYCNNWFAQASAAGYVPGVYIGQAPGLSPDQLYEALTTQHYWRAGGKISDVSRRGYQLLQTIPEDQEGDPPDTDLTQNDALGGAAIWLAPV